MNVERVGGRAVVFSALMAERATVRLIMTVVSFGFPELKLLETEKELGGKEGERPIDGMRE